MKMKRIVAVDMDGTLVAGNTWRFFASMMLRRSLARFQLRRLWRLTAAIVARRRGRLSHAELKYRFMLESHALPERCTRRFAECMSRRFNPEVMALIERERAKGAIILLATAAAGEYASLIAGCADIEHVVATPEAVAGVEYVETRGEHKADETEAFARRAGGEVTMVVTDHPDDLPLFRRFPKARHIMLEAGRIPEKFCTFEIPKD